MKATSIKVKKISLKETLIRISTDSMISLAICIRIVMSLKKMQVKQVEATMMQIKIRVVSSNVSSSNAEIRAGHKDWCICRCCKKEIRVIDCLCCQEVAAISEDNFEGN